MFREGLGAIIIIMRLGLRLLYLLPIYSCISTETNFLPAS